MLTKKQFLIACLATIFILLYEPTACHGKTLREGGKNVCSFHQSKTVYEIEKVKASKLVTVRVCCSRWLTCWKKCKRSRVLQTTVTRTISRLKHEPVNHCCQGFMVDSSGIECNKPICNPHCQNGGTCVGPNLCKCAKGFEGLYCQHDINECLTPEKTGCSQTCINLPGSYSCLCERGFVPGDRLSKTCKDINECKRLGGKNSEISNPCRCYGENCENVCQNTIGSFRCRCGSGYKLGIWNTCVDRNECIEMPDLCTQKCINTPGSYICQCWNGFRWNSIRKRCEEINECSIGKGGCEHFCHNVYGGHVCSCKNGFYLADDRSSCTDFNECNGPTRCDSRTSRCINTPGDYYCECRNGFEYSQYTRLCMDRNECNERTALCNQRCSNTFGSYRCSCYAGYYMTRDRRTCKDINECTRNVCDQVCINTPGSYKCFCNEGYMLDIDGKSCRPKVCEVIQAPFFGEINCDGFTVGKKCTFSCNSGYHLNFVTTRQCLPGGKWSSQQPKCIPNACQIPKPPPNGKLLLPCDQSYGSTCPVSCNRGYVLRGPNLLKCEMRGSTVKWDSHRVRCEEILVCKPNPCKNGGKCRIVSPTRYACNCSGTGHDGKNCQFVYVSIPRFPKMRLNQELVITLSAKPASYLNVTVYPQDRSVVVNPISFRFDTKTTSVNLQLTGKQTGIKSISYEISSAELYRVPKQSIFLVYNEIGMSRGEVTSLLDLMSGCNEMILQTKSRRCLPISVRSTKSWLISPSQHAYTEGLAVIKVGNTKFPLTIPTVDSMQSFQDLRKVFNHRFNSIQKQCRSNSLTTQQLQYVTKSDLFAKSFIKQFNTFLPTWFKVELSKGLKFFSENSIRSYVWTGEQVLAYDACSSLAIEKTGIFLVYLHHESLVLKVHDKTSPMDTEEVFCFALDVCNLEPHLQIPEKFTDDLVNMFSFQELMALGFKMKVKSVGFAKTKGQDSRKCLRDGRFPGANRIVFGGTNINYVNKDKVDIKANGDLVLAFKTVEGKEKIDLSSSCINGDSLFETPTWKATSVNLQEKKKESHLKFKTASPNNRLSILSFVQKDNSVFKMKSGLRPVIQKLSKDMKLDMKYRETEDSSAATGNSNFDTYSNLDILSYAVMDLASTLDMAIAQRQIAGRVTQLKNRANSWFTQLQTDVSDIMIDIDNTKLISQKAKTHLYKAKEMNNALKGLLDSGSSFIHSDSIQSLSKAQTDIKVAIEELEKSVKTSGGSKVFETLSVNFNGSLCLLKPCKDDFMITLHPQSTDVTKQGFCYDPSKTPFQMWDAKVVAMQGQRVGHFFEFSTGSRFYLCLSVFGVKKGKFNATFHLLGDKIKSEFMFDKPKMKFSPTNLKLFGKYRFKINGTVDASLNEWDMLSVTVDGNAGKYSDFVTALQRKMNKVSFSQYEKVKQRRKSVNDKILSLETEKDLLTSKIYSNRRAMQDAERSYAIAKATYRKNRMIVNQQKQIFLRNRQVYNSFNQKLDRICRPSTCPSKCIRMKECNVCQDELYGSKTVPKCKTEIQVRSYSYQANYKGKCSHFVEDRRLKYTGNCKEPGLETNAQKHILAELKRKQENNISLTIEDALNFELVNKEKGRELLKAIQKQNFFRSFPARLKEGVLTENDLQKLETYTNATFVKSIRMHLKNVKLSLLITELNSKIKRGGRISEEDYQRVGALSKELESKLRSSESLKAIQEKIQLGKKLTKEDLNIVKAANPEYFKNLTRIRDEREKQKVILSKIERKMQTGKMTMADINELAKINPKAAEKLKEALKEQLRKKVDEMKSKLTSVKSSIDSGFGSGDYSSLTKKLSQLTGNVKPFSRAELAKLERRIKQSLAKKGSLFDKVIERFDLAIEVQNITGSSSDLQRTLRAFFSTIEKFDLRKILQESQNRMTERLEDLQRWFETVEKFIDNLCSKCGKNCNRDNSVQKVLSELKKAVAALEKNLCDAKFMKQYNIDGVKRICRLVKKVKSFSQKYVVMKIEDCAEIKKKLLPDINVISKIWKQLRNSKVVLFTKLWQNRRNTKNSLNAYVSLSRGINSAMKNIPGGIKLPLLSYNQVIEKLKRSLTSGDPKVQDVEYLASKTAIKAFTDAVKLMQVNAKANPGTRVDIPRNIRTALVRNFEKLLGALSATLSCQNSLRRFKESKDQLGKVFEVARNEFNKMLSARKVSDLFLLSQKLSSVLEQGLVTASGIKKITEQCIPRYQHPLSQLDSFLNSVKVLESKTFKDMTNQMVNALGKVGNGIKAPIGKLMDQFNNIITNTPSFDIPLMLTMNNENFLLLMTSLNEYLQMISKIFSALIEVSDKCKKCNLDEVFGKYNLKNIAEKLDKKLKPISKKVFRFIEDVKFAFRGGPMLFSSFEKIRTNLQRIYKSETGFNKETLKEIVDVFQAAKEAITFIKKGKIEFELKFGGVKNREIFALVKEVKDMKKLVLKLREISKENTRSPTNELENVYNKINGFISDVPTDTKSIDGSKKGSIEQRIAILQDVARIQKDLTVVVKRLYATLRGNALRYFERTWIPKMGLLLDRVEEAKNSLFIKTQKLMLDIGVTGEDVKKKYAITKQRFSHWFDRMKRSTYSRKRALATQLERMVAAQESLITRITTVWKNIYSRLIGSVDKIKAHVTRLRTKFNKYADVFKEVQDTIREVKRGPLSQIGKIRDQMDKFAESLSDYDIRKIIISDPGVLKRKLREVKQLFQLSGATLKNVNKLLKRCKSCKVDDLLGKRYMKELAKNFEQKLRLYYDHLENFAEKFEDGASEIKNMTTAVRSMRNRFQEVYQGKKFGSEMLDGLSRALGSSAQDVDRLQSSIEDFTGIVFGKDVDLQVLRASYDGLVNQLKSALDKSSTVARNVENLLKQAKDFGEKLKELDKQISSLSKGPLDNRISIATDVAKGLKTLLNSLPALLRSSRSSLESAGIDKNWFSRFETGLLTVASTLEKVLKKTDTILEAAGILGTGKQNLDKKLLSVKNGIKELKRADWDEKIKVAGSVASHINNAVDSVLEIVALSGKSLHVSLQKEDLLEALQSVVGKERLAKFNRISRETMDLARKLQRGPISKVGRLTDSVEVFLDGLEDFDIGKVLLSNPASLKEKVTEFQQLVDGTADILGSILEISGVGKDGDLGSVFGKRFLNKVSGSVEKTFSKISDKVEKIDQRLKLGFQGWSQLVSTSKRISNSFKRVIKDGKITPDTFRRAASELRRTAVNLQTVKTSSSKIFKALLNDEKDLQNVQRKFKKLLDGASGVMKKAAGISERLEESYQTVNDLTKTFKSVAKDFDNLQKGPLDFRLNSLRSMMKGVKSILPAISQAINEQEKVGAALNIDTSWIQTFSKDLEDFSDSAKFALEKTDLALQAAGIAVQGYRNISDTAKELSENFRLLSRVPPAEKLKVFKKLISNVDDVFGTTINATSAVESLVKNVTGTDIKISKGLSRITDSVSGFLQNISKKVDSVEDIYNDITQTIKSIKSGPVSKIGALTDSVTDFVKSLKNYNLAEILLLSPKFAVQKLGDVKDIVKNSGQILKNISKTLSKVCPACNINEILGSKFAKSIQQGLNDGFERLVTNSTKFLNKVSDGAASLVEITKSVKGIEDQFSKLKQIRFNKDGIESLSEILDSSSTLLQSIGGNSSNIFSTLFHKNTDVLKLKGKFEGFVTNVASFLRDAGKVTDKVGDAFEKVEGVKKSFSSIQDNIKNVGEGPLEARVTAARNILEGVMAISSGLPDLLNSSSLGLKKTGFLRIFASQLRDVTDGVNQVLSKTKDVIGDVGSTVEGIGNIARMSGRIGNNVQEILRAPWSRKFQIAGQTVKQIGELTQEVNKFTGRVSDVVKKITGKTILSKPLFGDSVTVVLNDISKAVGLVADRYEKFQSLSRSVSKAFDDISSDPINFALNDLPKLFSEADSFIQTIISDTKGITDKLGINLDKINLNPKLVSAAKEFYTFAKGAIGTITSGKKLFTDFKELFKSKDFKDAMINIQKVTSSGKDFIKNFDQLGSSLFKDSWKNMKGEFKETVEKIGSSVGINMKKAGKLFGKGVAVAGNVIGIAADIESLLNMKEFNAETMLKAAETVINIGDKTVKILNTFGANIPTKALQAVGKFIGTAMAVYNIGKGIYDFIKWINDVCDITYATELVKKELMYTCLKTKLNVEKTRVPIDRCVYESTLVKKGYKEANLCCKTSKCVYLQSRSCLQANERCVQRRLQFANDTSNVPRDLAIAYERLETANAAMITARMDMKAAESLKARYQIASNKTFAAMRMNTLNYERAKKSRQNILKATRYMQEIVNEQAKTSKIEFLEAKFKVTLYPGDRNRLPMKVSYRDKNRAIKTLEFFVDFNNAEQNIEMTVKSLLTRITQYSLVRKRRSIDRNAGTATDKITKCTKIKSDFELLTNILKNLQESMNSLSSGPSYSRLRNIRTIKKSNSPIRARYQLVIQLMLLTKISGVNAKSVVENWKKDSENEIAQHFDNRCSGFKDCIDALEEDLLEQFDASTVKYEDNIEHVKLIKASLDLIAKGRLSKESINVQLRLSFDSLSKMQTAVDSCSDSLRLKYKLPKSKLVYILEMFVLECPVDPGLVVSYDWYLNNTIMPRHNERVLKILVESTDNEGSYHCQVSNGIDTIQSDSVFLKVSPVLKFIEDLKDLAIPESNPQRVTLTCNVTNHDDVSYKWWRKSLSGKVTRLRQTSAVINLGIFRRYHSGMYWCEVNDGYTTLRSRKATIAVVGSIRKSHSVKIRFDVSALAKDKRDNEVSSPPSSKQLRELNVKIKMLFLKDSSIDNVQINFLTDFALKRNSKNGILIVEMIIKPATNRVYSDEELAADDAQLQSKLRKMLNAFLSDDLENDFQSLSKFIGYSIQKSDVDVEWDLKENNCPAGMGLSENNIRCLPCLPGNFATNGRCKQCLVGSYQPKYNSVTCIPCGNGQLTKSKGNSEVSSCIKSDIKCFDKMKIIFAMDTSYDVDVLTFSRMKKFASSFIKAFDIKSRATRFSIATFDDASKLKVIFDAYESASELDAAISGMTQTRNSRRVDLLLDLTANVFDEKDDEDLRKVLVITTLAPDMKITLADQINLQKKVKILKDMNVEIFHVGIDRLTKEASIVSSAPKENHLFRIASSLQLMKSATMVANAVCDSVIPDN